ncbi:hypothetical protein GJ744_003915 [Endocarpon pusillum]|uniref:Zn(2)-C6 fungal-type domain-containing protein n=1 Tax=Endocarpon pusillum TaxID=364733 RepID=A0A8H7A787_9EURO|nr:hypothetical protein GJ744_003915 [Endocarpon pusillum]
MQNYATDVPLATSSQQSQRLPKTRSRISAACVRCQKRKIRCDAALPACSACQKAGANCVGGGKLREISHSYVNRLEARLQWLESIVRKNLPSIDLNRVPTDQSGDQKNYGPHDLEAPAPQNSGTHKNSPQDDDSLLEITEQVGLVSVSTGADLRYLGPSSGLFFTRFVLTGIGRKIQAKELSPSDSMNGVPLIPIDLLEVQPSDLPSAKEHAIWLSESYFETVHLQYPFLHEATHLETIRRMYDDIEVGPAAEFQVFMVLAIAATILSRQAKVQLSAEGYCASAMSRIDGIFQKASLTGVQCILLLQMYTLYNASSGLSLWTLHYHCLAWLIELGLQRSIQVSGLSHLEQEMRTRVFWCTYIMDRVLCTLMGRPLGIMDEQCDLRFPLDVNDDDLGSNRQTLGQTNESLTKMSSAIHLCKLATLNSEIKCVLYCVDRVYPPYTTPAITDLVKWKEDMLGRLHQWKEDIPQHPQGSPRCGTNLICEIKYHELVMLLCRPNPRIEHPSKMSLRECFSSAIECSTLYHKLYASSTLQYSWLSINSLFLCVIINFYCVWAPDGVADEVDFETLARALRCTSDVLSATGEYWPAAKRSRDVLDRVSTATLRRFTQKNKETGQIDRGSSGAQIAVNSSSTSGLGQTVDMFDANTVSGILPELQIANGGTGNSTFPPFYAEQADALMSTDILSYFMGSQGNMNINNFETFGECQPDMNGVMQNFFEDGFRDFDFGLQDHG